MGLKIEGRIVDVSAVKQTNNKLLHAYKSKHPGHNKITMTALEESIRASKEPDDHFIRQFVLYAIGVLLAPTTKGYVDSKYLAVVEKVKGIPKYNWGHFTLSTLLGGLHSFNSKPESANLQKNLALQQFWYWEHMQAYNQLGISYSPAPHPLMARWDETNATLRHDAFLADDIDGGVVVMTISNHIPTSKPTKNEPTHGAQEETRHRDQGEHHACSVQNQIANQQTEIILQAITKNRLEMEKIVLQLETRIFSKVSTLQEDLADNRIQVFNRVCALEDEIKNIRRELKNIKSALHKSVTPSNCQNLQEEKTPPDQHTRETEEGDGTLAGNADQDPRPQNTNNNLDNEPTEPVEKHTKPKSCTEVVDIANSELRVDILKPHVTGGWIYGAVIDAYAYINDIESKDKSVITTFQSKLLSGDEGDFEADNKKWALDIGQRCATRDLIFVPFNAHECHWTLLVLNFKTQKLQILNSLAFEPMFHDKRKETTLVKNLQECIDSVVRASLVSLIEPITITEWEKKLSTLIYLNKRIALLVVFLQSNTCWHGTGFKCVRLSHRNT
ncbi:hypothetical protein QOZ80_5BG0420580 [Eleusine coracana subsp. coracana]|nr:hypothetical protein QOZ80_5BG0420580 [Eleusine coracana subsp. coracana]